MKIFKSKQSDLDSKLKEVINNSTSGIIFTKGLQGSGKSTWAKKVAENYPGKVIRINKDDLRSMFCQGKFSTVKEKTMNGIRLSMIRNLILDSKWVICDDTHMYPGSHNGYLGLSNSVVCVDFTDVPLETCIKQDLNRLASVGKDVILKTWESNLPKINQDRNLEKCAIFDIDGTIAVNKNDSRHFDPTRYLEDLPQEGIINILNILSNNIKVFIFSGREGTEEGKANTITWLENSGIDLTKVDLIMRAEGDSRKDSVVKKEIFDNNIKDKYYCLGVFDDRFQVSCTWKELGLELFKCGPLYDYDLVK
jgi:tRNA uridine 5-carbamoylmethylation protein Kti12